MSLFGRRQARTADFNADVPIIPSRAAMARGAVQVTPEAAFRHSAVWAALRIRAGLISTFPIDVFRDVDGIQVDVPKPPIITEPGGKHWRYMNWMYASQVDLDRTGNAIGIITETDKFGLPRRIDLQAATSCSVLQRAGESKIRYRINGVEYPAEKIWHERQYPLAGLPVGLSPIAYAAWTIGEYLSIQQFALDWFGGGGIPKARLRNTQKKLDGKEAGILKDRWRATVANGDLFVHGNDWEYNLMQAESAGAEWIEGRKYGVSDIARFFDVPGDMIEAPPHGSKLVYANISQKNMDFLIIHLGPAVARREDNLNQLLPAPRYVKLNTDALMRMDPQTRAQVLGYRLQTKQITPSEGRAYENLRPFTDDQIAEIEKVYGPPKAAPVAAGTGTPPAPAAGK